MPHPSHKCAPHLGSTLELTLLFERTGPAPHQLQHIGEQGNDETTDTHAEMLESGDSDAVDPSTVTPWNLGVCVLRSSKDVSCYPSEASVGKHSLAINICDEEATASSSYPL